MYDDWTKCTECQFFDPEKYYCKRLLHTVTIGCPYGEPKQETHYDRIVSKTPEELAEFLTTEDICELICAPVPPHCDGQCKQKMLDWLKQEAKE